MSFIGFDPIESFAMEPSSFDLFNNCFPQDPQLSIELNSFESNLLGSAINTPENLITEKKCNRWTRAEDNRLKRAVKKYGNR